MPLTLVHGLKLETWNFPRFPRHSATMSIARPYPIRCPKCGVEAEVRLYDSINVGEDPQLREDLMANRLNAVTCGACAFQYRVDKPLLYVDPARKFAVWWTPEGAADPAKADDEYRRMQDSLREAPGAADLGLHLVHERVELVERIFLLEAGLDARLVEYVKYLIFSKNARKVDPQTKRLLFNAQDSDPESLCFVVQDVESRRLEGVLKYDRKMLTDLETMFATNPTQPLAELFPHPYISARKLMLD